MATKIIDNELIECPACEEGTCETHNQRNVERGDDGAVGGSNSGSVGRGGNVRRESSELRVQVARVVRKLNAAIKKQRAQGTPVNSGEPISEGTPAPIASRKRSDVAGFTSNVLHSLKKKPRK